MRGGVPYVLRSHIFKVLAHHDASEFGFNETFSSFPLRWPRKKNRRLQNYRERRLTGTSDPHGCDGGLLGYRVLWACVQCGQSRAAPSLTVLQEEPE